MNADHILKISQSPKHKTRVTFPCDNTSHCFPYKIIFPKGTFLVELWGAGATAGGAYVSGEIHFYQEQTMYLFIGGVAPTGGSLDGIGGYNGGGTSSNIGIFNNKLRQIGGDGATDLRLEKDNFSSRIMVAGGAGGGSKKYPGGYGGGLIGGNGTMDFVVGGHFDAFGGTQTEGGKGQYQGEFGMGAISSPTLGTDLAGCGGGGWYGGGSGYDMEQTSSGGGGSSFINGYEGCSLNHPLFVFHHSKMIPGNEVMPSLTEESSKRSSGNGFARITCIDPVITCKKKYLLHPIISFAALFLAVTLK